MSVMTATKTNELNGIDLDALQGVVEQVTADPSAGKVGFRVTSRWQGRTRSEARVESFEIGGRKVARSFAIPVDEPFELLGENTAPNPQELLMTALNACVLVGYVAGAAVRGVRLDKVEIETTGELDLRGFLGIDPAVPAGYEKIAYTVRMKGSGTPEQFREIHETVVKTSPNYFNISRPVAIDARLVVET